MDKIELDEQHQSRAFDYLDIDIIRLGHFNDLSVEVELKKRDNNYSEKSNQYYAMYDWLVQEGYLRIIEHNERYDAYFLTEKGKDYARYVLL
jgi:hypothetical protein